MKAETPDGYIYKIGDLRISGPINEVDEFLDWLKCQPACDVVVSSNVSSSRDNIRSTKISINCRLSFDEILAAYITEDIKYGLATPAPPSTNNPESPDIEF